MESENYLMAHQDMTATRTTARVVEVLGEESKQPPVSPTSDSGFEPRIYLYCFGLVETSQKCGCDN